MTKQEILDKMMKARTWHELGIGIKEVYTAFADETDRQSGESDEIRELKEKISRLNETNKVLRAENKKLRG